MGGSSTFKAVAVADTSITSDNLGDQVIMGALERELRADLVGRARFVIPTHSPIGYRGKRILDDVPAALVGGTNILPAAPGPRQLWRLPPLPARQRKFVLVACGFNQSPTQNAGKYLRSILHPDAEHSCRDFMTTEFLESIGFRARMTGCVTTWSITDESRAATERVTPSREAVVIINGSLGHQRVEQTILEAASSVYDSLSFWFQASRDVAVLENASWRGRNVVSGGPTDLAHHLEQSGADVVTTRLHAALLSQRVGARCTLFALDDRVARTCDAVSASYASAPSTIDHAVDALRQPATAFTPRSSDIERWRVALRDLLDQG